MSRNEQAYPRECVEAEQLVRSAIMRIINDSLHGDRKIHCTSRHSTILCRFLQEALSQGR
jgi:hypothetical protein